MFKQAKCVDPTEPPEPSYMPITKYEFETAIEFLKRALHCKQLGLNPENLELAFVHKTPDYYTRQLNYMSSPYIRVIEISKLTFKTQQQLDAEEEAELQAKIEKLKTEIDAKSKELAEIAKRAKS